MTMIELLLVIAIIALCYLIYKLNKKNEEYNSLKIDCKRIHDLYESQQKNFGRIESGIRL